MRFGLCLGRSCGQWLTGVDFADFSGYRVGAKICDVVRSVDNGGNEVVLTKSHSDAAIRVLGERSSGDVDLTDFGGRHVAAEEGNVVRSVDNGGTEVVLSS